MVRLETKVWLALATIYLVWGSTFMAVTVAVRDLPPFLSMGIRHLVAGALLLAWALPRGDRAGDRIGPRQLGAAAIFGGALFLGGHGGLAWAQQTVPSGVVGPPDGQHPALGRRARPGRVREAAPPPGGSRARDRLPRASPFWSIRSARGASTGSAQRVAVFAAFAWAAGSLYSRGAPLPRRPIVSAGLAASAAACSSPSRRRRRASSERPSFTPEAVASVAYLIVFGTLLGFTAYVWLLRVAPISLVATYAYVNPIVAVFLGWTLLEEEITVSMLAAGAAIVVSVALIVATSNRVTEPGRGLRRSPPEPAPEFRPPP